MAPDASLSEGTSTATPSAPTAAPAPALTNPDTIQTYQTLYDVLGRAYWEASDITAKDTIQGARDAIYEILTDLNRAKLDANTALFLSLKSKIRDSNKALEEVKDRINTITKNISTASSVIAAIAKVVSIAPTLL
ncbi:hypothetical protein [Edaphobacter sp. 12200R-103]|jgi:hypothetical protein|uniref:hypothetical protein n=1 Tax=Edaphobacter sp. 12200R-103 TaxID=2703788 RepID=UPI00138B42BF|nr:hypothetical protein [Edaphobacter sp. 12200R-103]QHS52291.1 hypothetical protein GWR55_11550 [Edaphobacter sp. 12200R-103]